VYQASYDEAGRLFRERLANGDAREFSYDAHGLKASEKRMRGETLLYEAVYESGRLVERRPAHGEKTSYDYDKMTHELRTITAKAGVINVKAEMDAVLKQLKGE
jgi:YD repeat-containing protein